MLFSGATIASDVKDKELWWDIASSAILLPLGGIGIVLYVLGVNDASLKSTWKVISILIVAGQLLTNVVSRHLMLSGERDLDPEKISQWAILVADLFTVMLLAPMFVLNILFAFS